MKEIKFLALTALFGMAFMVQANTLKTLSKEQANEEYETVVGLIQQYHPNPFHAHSKNKFYRLYNEFVIADENSVSLSNHYFRLAKLVSMVNDTHTQLHIVEETRGFPSTLPIRVKWFPEGLYIIAASSKHHDLIGNQILSIGGKPTESILNELLKYSFADHKLRKRVYAELYFYWPEMYEEFGLINDKGEVEMEVRNQKGEKSVFQWSQWDGKGVADYSWDSINPYLPTEFVTVHEKYNTQVPYYLSKLDNNYHYDFLDEDRKYFYLQINKQFAKPAEEGELPSEFHLDWAKSLWQAPTELMIIDLRNNPGGTINIGDALSGTLSMMYYEHPTLKVVALLFGTDTVSAGTVIISQLEDKIRPIMIGSASGSSPNMYLTAKTTVLPHSGISFDVSTEDYRTTGVRDTRRYIMPDIPLEMTFAEYLQGYDPLIELAKTLKKSQRHELYQDNYDTPWLRPSQQQALKARD